MSSSQEFSAQSNGKDIQKGLQSHVEDDYIEDSLGPVYSAKAKVLNDALQEIGMGKYQVCLTFLYPLIDILNLYPAVVFIRCRRFRLLFVSSQVFKIHFRTSDRKPISDGLWPVSADQYQ